MEINSALGRWKWMTWAAPDGYFFSEHLRRREAGEPTPGLTDIGRQVVAEMNRRGIIVDLCHLSRTSMREVLAICGEPVLAGHTTAKALGHRLPSLTDEEIRAIADKGSVIGLHFMTHMLTGRMNPPATMDEVLAQIDHIVNVEEIDVMALGPELTSMIPAVDFATTPDKKCLSLRIWKTPGRC